MLGFTTSPAPFLRRFFMAILMVCATVFVVGAGSAGSSQPLLSAAELKRIGQRIWENECNGSVEGLTSWNSGESFASLGIGHFIWYPAGQEGPFEESFPPLIAWLHRNGVAVPDWVLETPDCPWPTRAAFQKDFNSPRLRELRSFLSKTVIQQTQFILARLEAAAPRLQAAAGAAGPRVKTNLELLRQTSAGTFALIDYVNFKGEGLNREERYKGEGWGLLQVLAVMQAKSAADAPRAFASAAAQVLTRRVQNSPPQRNERQWLAGWVNRCHSYAR